MENSNAGLMDEMRQVLSGAVFTRLYGFRLHAVEEGSCTLLVPFQPQFERPGGIVSGPVYMAAADAAMWLAIVTRLGKDDVMAVTTGMTTAFLNAAQSEDFFCTARVVKTGKRFIYGTAECATGAGKLLTHHTLSYTQLSAS